MKKITLKIFFAFFFILIFTHVSIFFILHFSKISQAKKDHEYYRLISDFAFREVVQSRFKPYSIDEVRDNLSYKTIISDVSEKYNIDIIVTDKNNKILIEPASGSVSDDMLRDMNIAKSGGIDDIRNPFPVFIPFSTENGDELNIYLFHEYKSSSDFLLNSLLAILFIINIILLLLLSSKLTKPVDKFDKAIRAISEGNFSARIKIKDRKDEFRDLADTFNSMAAKLKEVIAEQKEKSAIISHELRSPLTRISVALQILRDSVCENNSASEEYFDSIEKDIKGMDSLIDGILKYYRLDSISSQVIEKIDIIEMLNNEISKQSKLFESNQIKIEYNPIINNLKVDILPSVRSVFENIIGNAAKYTKDGGYFKITVRNFDDNLKIVFENSIGKNIDIDTVRLCEPFYRGKNSENIQGSGIGLAIAKKIADINDLKLDFEIEEDIFRVILII